MAGWAARWVNCWEISGRISCKLVTWDRGKRMPQYMEKFRRVWEGWNLRMLTGTCMLKSPVSSSLEALAARKSRARI